MRYIMSENVFFNLCFESFHFHVLFYRHADVGTFWSFSEHFKNITNLDLSIKANLNMCVAPQIGLLESFKARYLFSRVVAPLGQPISIID